MGKRKTTGREGHAPFSPGREQKETVVGARRSPDAGKSPRMGSRGGSEQPRLLFIEQRDTQWRAINEKGSVRRARHAFIIAERRWHCGDLLFPCRLRASAHFARETFDRVA
jgi:hypothetical protein